MKAEQHSEEERRQTILKIKENLEREGFKTTWQDPFFAWIHGTPLDKKGSEHSIGDTLYISNPPVRKVTPFDFTMVSLRSDHDHIFFELSLYYCKELEGIVDAHAINKIYDRHAGDWAPKMAVYFNDIATEFSLRWDTEYDVYIEDSLYGNFPVESPDQIISLMRAIKKCWLEWERNSE